MENSVNTEMESIFNDALHSQINFNDRIFNEAIRSSNPLLERINYLCIMDSNTDEFIRTKFKEGTGLKNRIMSQTHKMEELADSMIDELDNYGIKIMNISSLSTDDINTFEPYLLKVFYSDIYPILQPMILADELPIPEFSDGGLFLITKFSDGVSCIIKIPYSRLHKVKIYEKTFYFRTEDMVFHFSRVYYAHSSSTIIWNKLLRVFRKIDSLSTDTEDKDKRKKYIQGIRDNLKARKKAEVVMIDISEKIEGIDDIVGDAKKRKRKYVAGLSFLSGIKDLIKDDYFNDKESLAYPKFKPRIPVQFVGNSVFKRISKNDILVHFPYESFEYSTIRFLEEAAVDPKVKIIRQTLYRVANDSPLIKALCTAAKNGKDVIVLIELKAKMDERHNLELISELEESGCHVIYGPIQMKTHAKITLVIREEDGKYCKYANISTGNFNDKTAKGYEDFSYFCKERSKNNIGNYLVSIFSMLGAQNDYIDENDTILVAPYTFRKRMVSEIDKCINNKIKYPDKDVNIVIKCNAFTDEKMALKLYEASKANVKVQLIVRGMCIVKCGVSGLSENISCKSIIGRFLEHSRVYQFTTFNETGETDRTVYIGSGDMMPRNLDYRVEVLISIKNKEIKDKLHSILEMYIQDEFSSYAMKPDGTYDIPKEPCKEGDKTIQTLFIEEAKALEKELLKS